MRRLAVLGGAGGIGRALVARAVAEGWRVSVLDLPASLERHPVPEGVRAIALDATDAASVGAAFAQLEDGIDGFVNLAGFLLGMRKLESVEPEFWDEVVAGNLRAAFLTARAALPLLAKGDNPAMVQMVSGLAAHTRPGYGPYAACKAAMVSMTKTMALEAAPLIRVNAVGPGAVDTAFLRGGTGRSDESGQTNVDIPAYSAMMPLKRIAVPSDVVGPVMFLLGPDSAYMTGQVLWVNGGAYMP
ncbi:SDR family NAD(P)-dependent oxidoreductase [Falsiroseomonas stagni]|uniref:NAD(P)-dependent dehydrogenase, short-chain alcohol dehydrogenase family n=1 Tax=Falsiroseomonas stagni DSM 19981 TaxID=1123062 RepID=A0A1I4EBN1_9PROT|nr:SDR family oxidoreductase [Falsiroseomonas stagni]SFL01591.1 NAD(P)-dependent dehydrogenase, short-chain alcohol dehydrogenase family [Falsiroseomonas stagni DSM 19981]